MKSFCLSIPPLDDLYPWRSASAGLQRLGALVMVGAHIDCDVLVTWSPWLGSRRHALQCHYNGRGKPVIVMENGWLSPLPMPNASDGGPFFQVALDGWNGTGKFPAGGTDRLRGWRCPEMPWRDHPNGHILVIGQRGHPTDMRTAPPGWHETLGPFDRPPVRRGRDASRPLLADLRGAREVHVWTSNAASHAVLEGIPVVQHGPNLMVSAMASRHGEPLYRGDRGAELARLAWAQWSKAEIETGEPFARLLAA